MFSGVLAGSLRAMKSMGLQGDPAQMGGCVVVKSDATMVYYHRDKGPFGHVRINDILRFIGAETVDFAKRGAPILDV